MSAGLLVHGVWHDGRCWDRVVPLLTSAGHRVLAPSLTDPADVAWLRTTVSDQSALSFQQPARLRAVPRMISRSSGEGDTAQVGEPGLVGRK